MACVCHASPPPTIAYCRSAPCAISCYGVGWGVSLGGQLTDVLLVLRTEEAVRAFAAGKTLGLGGTASLALGPLGRSAEASLRLGGLAAKGAVLGYSCSKGAYAGVSLEGTVTSCRDAVNRAFYGYSASPRQLLVDCSIPQPPAAALLYDRLDSLTALWENRGSLVHAGASAAATAVPAAASCKPITAAAGDRQGLGKQQQSAAAAAAAAGSSAGVRPLSSSNDSSSSREWDMVGTFAAADALEQFEDPPQSLPSPQRWQYPQEQQQQQQVVVEESDDDIDDFLASAPPAPTHLLHDYRPSAQQQQQQEDDDEETMYALEW